MSENFPIIKVTLQGLQDLNIDKGKFYFMLKIGEQSVISEKFTKNMDPQTFGNFLKRNKI